MRQCGGCGRNLLYDGVTSIDDREQILQVVAAIVVAISAIRKGGKLERDKGRCGNDPEPDIAANGALRCARQRFRKDPRNGAVFCFINKERTRLKMLYWDGTGVWVLAKRLEKGRFSWPTPSEARKKLSLAPEALALLVGGVELKQGSLKAWYER